MDDAIRSRFGTLFRRLKTLSADGEWRNDLEAALCSVEFSDQQLMEIRQAASLTFMKSCETNGDAQAFVPALNAELTHAFVDAARHCALSFDAISDPMLEIQGDMALQILTRARYAFRDIIHNYPLLLGERMPESVREILATYESEILPEIDGLIAELSDETGMDPNEVIPSGHWEHLRALPPEMF
ncbi:MAG: hypothetical protein KDI61_10335 [Alphaproteobacteria bacterium]|nr:hypothetical protein [Alphaproteobacteria bacterium]